MIGGAIGGGIFKLVFGGLAQSAGEILNFANKVENEVRQAMLGLVTQGFDEIWRGEDADQFKQKVQNVLSPGLSSIFDNLKKYVDGLNKAAERMKKADQDALGKVQELGNLFKGIF